MADSEFSAIVRALRDPKLFDVRVSYGRRWLYFDQVNKEYVVREQVYRARNSNVLYRGFNEDLAVEALTDDVDALERLRA